MRERRRTRSETPGAVPRVAAESPSEKNYRIVSISLYADQAALVDQTVRDLVAAGYLKASRSLVIQTAIQRLREDLAGRQPEEILRYFIERQIRRPLASAESRTHAQQLQPKAHRSGGATK